MSYLVAKDETAPLWLLIATIIVLLSVIYILIQALRDALKSSTVSLPAIRAVIPSPENDDKPILLLEPSELFGISSRVSIYHRFSDTDYELLIGYGSVLTIQGDGRIQIKVDDWVGGNAEIMTGINNQTQSYLSGTIIKPSAPVLAKDDNRLGMSSAEIDQIFRVAQILRELNSLPGALPEEKSDE